jgi:hypothetical protein
VFEATVAALQDEDAELEDIVDTRMDCGTASLQIRAVLDAVEGEKHLIDPDSLIGTLIDYACMAATMKGAVDVLLLMGWSARDAEDAAWEIISEGELGPPTSLEELRARVDVEKWYEEPDEKSYEEPE